MDDPVCKMRPGDRKQQLRGLQFHITCRYAAQSRVVSNQDLGRQKLSGLRFIISLFFCFLFLFCFFPSSRVSSHLP